MLEVNNPRRTRRKILLRARPRLPSRTAGIIKGSLVWKGVVTHELWAKTTVQHPSHKFGVKYQSLKFTYSSR